MKLAIWNHGEISVRDLKEVRSSAHFAVKEFDLALNNASQFYFLLSFHYEAIFANHFLRRHNCLYLTRSHSRSRY